jgi:histidine ammonia-lyase
MARNAADIIAIELLAAAQGVDMRRPLTTSPALVRVMREIRNRAAFLDQDRSMAGDIAAIRGLIESGWFRSEVAPMLPST